MWWTLLVAAHATPLLDAPAIGPALHPTVVIQADDLPPSPPPGDATYGAVDFGDVVVVRPQGSALELGFSYGPLYDSMLAALEGRSTEYDFVLALNTSRLPTQFTGAAAFYLGYNNDDHQGTGTSPHISPTVPTKAVLWMNTVDAWDSSPEYSAWVFGQELGHHWLAFPWVDFDDGEGEQSVLLGRDNSHWSYWLDTPNSPSEGNRWIDNGDGTFTTDLDSPAAFSDLDLYLMGLIAAEDVSPWFYIEPDAGSGRADSSPPEWLYGNQPVTVSGTRVDVTLDDVIAFEGDRLPTPATSQKDFRILTMLVLTESEVLNEEIMTGVGARQTEWANAWSQLTAGLSTVSFSVVDEGRSAPPLPDTVALVPRGAW